MVVRLEDMLRPGERVVYRTPEGRLPEEWCTELAAVGWIVALIVFVVWVASASDVRATLALALVFSVIAALAISDEEGGHDAAVTDQRAITVDTRLDKLVSTSVELHDVQRFEVWGWTLRITKADGTLVELKTPGRSAEIARALAREAGLPLPSLHRSRVGIASEATLYGTIFTLTCTIFIFFMVADPELPAVGWPLQFVYTCLFCIAVGLAWFLAVGLVALLVLRPFFTREELRELVLRTKTFFSHPDEPKFLRFLPRLYLRLVDRLYGGPTQPEPEGHGDGG